jgi:hypothetical protein
MYYTNIVLLLERICLDLNVVRREEWDLLAAGIPALNCCVSSSVLLITIHKYLVFLTPSMPPSAIVNI